MSNDEPSAASNVIIARQLIRSKTLVRRPDRPQPDTRPLATIGREEDHTLPLKSCLKNCRRGRGCARFAIGFSPSDGSDRQARLLGKFDLQ